MNEILIPLGAWVFGGLVGMGIGARLVLHERKAQLRHHEQHHNKFPLPGAKPVRCEWRIVPVSDD